MLKYISYVVICFFSFSCTNNITCDKIETDYFFITKKLHTSSDTFNFKRELNDVIIKEPLCFKAYQVRGFFGILSEDYLLAKADFLQTLRLKDSSVYSMYCLSNLYNIEGKNDSSLFFVQKAIQLKVSDGYFIDKNNALSETFDISYDKLIFQRGLIYYESGLIELAKKDFLKSLQLGYESSENSAYLAAAYLKLKNLDSACYYFKQSKQSLFNELIEQYSDFKCNDTINLLPPEVSYFFHPECLYNPFPPMSSCSIMCLGHATLGIYGDRYPSYAMLVRKDMEVQKVLFFKNTQLLYLK